VADGRIEHAGWIKGRRRYGEHAYDRRFVCPSCSTVVTVRGYKAGA